MGVFYENKQYPYLYETHLHTKEASACAHNSAAEMVEALSKAGYTGMFITDHFYYGNSNISKQQSWKQWVEEFTQGYLEAKELGDQIQFQVFLAWEANYNATEFLIYGLGRQWLLEHPEIKDATIEEQFELVSKHGGMVIQAHPFREEIYIPEIKLYPAFVHGVEAVNATHSNHSSKSHYNPEFDEKAISYSIENRLPMTAGSDIHTNKVHGGGMAFQRKLQSEQDFINAVIQQEPYLLLNGNEEFFKKI